MKDVRAVNREWLFIIFCNAKNNTHLVKLLYGRLKAKKHFFLEHPWKLSS